MAKLFAGSLATLALLLLLFAPSDARPGIKATNDFLGDVCGRTKNSSYCINGLTSAGITDPKALAMFILDVAQSSVKAILDLLPYLIQITNDPALKDRYKVCNTSFSAALPKFDDAKKDLASDNYVKLITDIVSVKDDAQACVDVFKKPPADPSTLPHHLEICENSADIAIGVAKYLQGS